MCPECGHGSSDPRDERAHLDAHRQLRAFFQEWEAGTEAGQAASAPPPKRRSYVGAAAAIVVVLLVSVATFSRINREPDGFRPTVPPTEVREGAAPSSPPVTAAPGTDFARDLGVAYAHNRPARDIVDGLPDRSPAHHCGHEHSRDHAALGRARTRPTGGRRHDAGPRAAGAPPVGLPPRNLPERPLTVRSPGPLGDDLPVDLEQTVDVVLEVEMGALVLLERPPVGDASPRVSDEGVQAIGAGGDVAREEQVVRGTGTHCLEMGAARSGHDRDPRGHGLHHAQAERLRRGGGQQDSGPAEQCRDVGHLAQELDRGVEG
jgi:hypothetical protein